MIKNLQLIKYLNMPDNILKFYKEGINHKELNFSAYYKNLISEMTGRGLPTIIPSSERTGFNIDYNVLKHKGYVGSVGVYAYNNKTFLHNNVNVGLEFNIVF